MADNTACTRLAGLRFAHAAFSGFFYAQAESCSQSESESHPPAGNANRWAHSPRSKSIPHKKHADPVQADRRVLFYLLLIPNNSDKRQIAIQFIQIQPVAVHKFIRDVEAHVIEFHFRFAPLVLIEQRANLQAGRQSRL